MAIDHYENFPVASILLPARLRPAVQNIYRYARSADDIADEGDALPQDRLQQLSDYRIALDEISTTGLNSHHNDDIRRIFLPLQATIRQYGLPVQPFHDLLSAFEQDISKTRYESDAELLDYCRRSANPVGRLMLHLYGATESQNLDQADAICTGLQLTNFWQDVAIDWQKNRVYIPQEKLQAYGIGEDYIATNTNRMSILPPDARWQNLMQTQVHQARELLLRGLPLCNKLSGRIGYELRLVVHGGLHILRRLDALHYDIFFQRPALRKRDWVLLVLRACLPRS